MVHLLCLQRDEGGMGCGAGPGRAGSDAYHPPPSRWEALQQSLFRWVGASWKLQGYRADLRLGRWARGRGWRLVLFSAAEQLRGCTGYPSFSS